jgi:methyl-accepting chemotaxis protein
MPKFFANLFKKPEPVVEPAPPEKTDKQKQREMEREIGKYVDKLNYGIEELEQKKEMLFDKAATAAQNGKTNMKEQIFASIASIDKIVSTIVAIEEKMSMELITAGIIHIFIGLGKPIDDITKMLSGISSLDETVEKYINFSASLGEGVNMINEIAKGIGAIPSDGQVSKAPLNPEQVKKYEERVNVIIDERTRETAREAEVVVSEDWMGESIDKIKKE